MSDNQFAVTLLDSPPVARPRGAVRRIALGPSLFSILLPALLFFTGCEEGKYVDVKERSELELIFKDARRLDEQGRYHEALVRYETILAHHPEYMSTRLNAAMSAYDSGQYQKSTDHFEVLHKYSPSDWFVVRKLIQCYERLDKKELVALCKKKLEGLRALKDGSVLLKRYEGHTRDYIPMGSMHLLGYEFFDFKKHGRMSYFKLEDKDKAQVSAFLLQATAFHDAQGRRLFSLTESASGWMKIWHVGPEGRDYKWTRDFVLECLHGERTPLVVKPLPPDYDPLPAPGEPGAPGDPSVAKDGSQQPPPAPVSPAKKRESAEYE
jgi:hypothetical protein